MPPGPFHNRCFLSWRSSLGISSCSEQNLVHFSSKDRLRSPLIISSRDSPFLWGFELVELRGSLLIDGSGLEKIGKSPLLFSLLPWQWMSWDTEKSIKREKRPIFRRDRYSRPDKGNCPWTFRIDCFYQRILWNLPLQLGLLTWFSSYFRKRKKKIPMRWVLSPFGLNWDGRSFNW